MLRSRLIAAALAVPLNAATENVRAIARQAYEAAYQHPFDGRILEEAAKNIDRAHSLNDKEPYVWLGASEVTLAGGFHSGSTLEGRNYEPGSELVGARNAARRTCAELL